MTDRKRFRRHVAWLRRHFPSSHPVRVHLTTAKIVAERGGEQGVCESWPTPCGRFPAEFRVSILDTLNEDQTIQVLAHEWAHVLRGHLYRFGDLNAEDAIRALIENEIWSKWHGEG
jgi:hypothetical protein